MPDWPGLGSGVHVGRDLVQADLDTVFALLFIAETEGLSGQHGNALRALEEAHKAIDDGEQRLLRRNDSDRESLLLQLRRMRAVIDGIRSNLG
jgi:hypothetical protein